MSISPTNHNIRPRGGPLLVVRFIDSSARQSPFVEHRYFRRRSAAVKFLEHCRNHGRQCALYVITVKASDWAEVDA